MSELSNKADPPIRTTTIIERRSGGGLVILGIIALALILAIGFFLVEKQHPRDAQADAVVGAAESVGNAATRIGDAAAKSAEKLDKHH